jgi:hypothetical protein
MHRTPAHGLALLSHLPCFCAAAEIIVSHSTAIDTAVKVSLPTLAIWGMHTLPGGVGGGQGGGT